MLCTPAHDWTAARGHPVLEDHMTKNWDGIGVSSEFSSSDHGDRRAQPVR